MPFVHFYACQNCHETFTKEKFHSWPIACPTCHHEQQHLRTFKNVLEVKQAHKLQGGHWFDKETMRFFHSRVGDTVYHGCYFISSEAYEYGGERYYNVHSVSDTGSIDTVCEHMTYTSHKQALTALNNYVKSLEASQESE